MSNVKNQKCPTFPQIWPFGGDEIIKRNIILCLFLFVFFFCTSREINFYIYILYMYDFLYLKICRGVFLSILVGLKYIYEYIGDSLKPHYAINPGPLSLCIDFTVYFLWCVLLAKNLSIGPYKVFLWCNSWCISFPVFILHLGYFSTFTLFLQE